VRVDCADRTEAGAVVRVDCAEGTGTGAVMTVGEVTSCCVAERTGRGVKPWMVCSDVGVNDSARPGGKRGG
jgi:hypothetical protein